MSKHEYPVNFKVDSKLYTKAKIYCFDNEITLKKFFNQMLEDFFKDHPLPKKRK